MKQIQITTVGEVCQTISDTYRANAEQVTLINTSDVLDGRVLNHARVPNEGLKGQFKKTFKRDDILYSEIRPQNKRYAFVDFNPVNYIASTKLMVIRADESKVLPMYLYYFLKSAPVVAELQLLAETRSGTFPQITFSELANLEIPVPAVSEQKAIVTTIKCIEDRITCNENINDNLQQQAEAIYHDWFIDFKPFGGTMPETWCIGTLADLAADIICGKTPSTKRTEYYGSDTPFITIPDMHNQVYAVTTERSLSVLGAKSQAGKILPHNSTCVSCIGTAGLVCLVARPSQTNQQVNSIVPKADASPYYIYLLAQTLSDTIQRLGSGGSTICNLNKAQFARIEALIPSSEAMRDFDNLIAPMFDAIMRNQQENQHLTSLRNTLLPKLMSGEIDVSSIEI